MDLPIAAIVWIVINDGTEGEDIPPGFGEVVTEWHFDVSFFVPVHDCLVRFSGSIKTIIIFMDLFAIYTHYSPSFSTVCKRLVN